MEEAPVRERAAARKGKNRGKAVTKRLSSYKRERKPSQPLTGKIGKAGKSSGTPQQTVPGS